ncbi:two-component sensor histidine kinase [Streptomyces sp. WAC 06738]|uniref:sensor histidine kinase n=1 Tax=Streptomyces sp. WAC 06738 TaxID=2203210 RepID=UPI000F6F6AE2|nr:histidine kinase [Streptomyces sp. WAC 06738]AZM49706.1 two-component sensor histidine kinase [Streptomyces sp. WAC 06738]
MSGNVPARQVQRILTRRPHPLVLLDCALAVLLCVGLLWADSRSGAHHAAGGVHALRTAGTVFAALAVAARRLRPRSSFAVASLLAFAVAALGGAPQVSVCVALTGYTIAATTEYAFWWVPPGAAGLLMAAGVGIGRFSPGWPAVLVANVAIVCAGWFAGLAVRERRKRIAAAAEQEAERERQHAARIRQAAIDERLVIARELHDIVAHSMSLIAVRAGVARMVMESDPGQVAETLGIVETTTRQALHEMRLLVEVLRHEDAVDPALTPTPGLADTAALAGQIRSAGVDLRLDVRGTARRLPAAVDLSAYRIAQEALTNVVRHAGPTRATLRIEYRTEEVVIEVTDSGPFGPHRREDSVLRSAAEPAATAGHGLIGMRERAALFGGYLHAGPHGDGFRVQALLRTDEAGPPATATTPDEPAPPEPSTTPP